MNLAMCFYYIEMNSNVKSFYTELYYIWINTSFWIDLIAPDIIVLDNNNNSQTSIISL